MALYKIEFVTPTKTPATLMTPECLLIQAVVGGVVGDDLSLEILTGATGAGNEDRTLAVGVSVDQITVTLGTDSSGDTVLPLVAEIAEALASDGPASAKIVAADCSDAGSIAPYALTNLANGSESTAHMHVDGSELIVTTYGQQTVAEFAAAFQPGDQMTDKPVGPADWPVLSIALA